MENDMEVPQKLKTELLVLYDSAISLLDIYLKENKSLFWKKKICTPYHWSTVYNSQDMETT